MGNLEHLIENTLDKYLSQNDELMKEIATFYHKVADVIGSDAE